MGNRPRKSAGRWSALRLAALLPMLCAVQAQARDDRPILGFPGGATERELALEERFAAGLDAANLRSWLKDLSAKPHPGGSPGSRAVAEYIAEKFRTWGFHTEIETFYALVSTPKDRVVEMVAPYAYKASLTELAVPGRTPENTEGLLPPYNVYSKDGDVTAPAVYVNYGLPEDYEVLARHGINVKGKIVIARYGRSYRGVKPRLAGEKGAIGAILYSDPADDGYAQGATYPDGPFLPENGYQRGSVMDIPYIAGDPLTPGIGATERPDSFSVKDASRVLSPVPVLPLSASDIRPILESMTGPTVPPEWRGALPITYRFDGTVKVRLKVAQNWEIVPMHDVVAKLQGSTWPDEWVLHGNNHDAGTYGAMVALSGLVTLMEEARGIAELTKTGWRPKRTLVYLAWDGEEQALLGSTEWAETHAEELLEKAVSYLNTGVITPGFFLAGGSHSLETLVNGVSRVVKDPRLAVPVYDRIAAYIGLYGSDAEREDLQSSARYRLEPLGLGSDSTPFLHHLGIPTLDFRFDGEAPSGVYHSIYDNFDFYDRFGDPGFRYGVKLAEASGRTMLRLANADVLPFEFSGMAYAISKYASEVETLVEEMRENTLRSNADIEAGLYRLADDSDASLLPPRRGKEVPDIDFAPLQDAVSVLRSSANRFAAARESYEISDAPLEPNDLTQLNKIVAQAEQALAPEDGLPERPWYRHHVYAPGYYSGYGVKTLPSLREAAERRKWKEVKEEIMDIASLIESYAARIDSASELLERAAQP